MGTLSLSLALFNFLPVLFSALALLLIARLVRQVDPDRQWLAWVGAVLAILGGLSKASWKLMVVATGQDIPWLASALFPLLGPGFVLLAGGVWGALRRIDGQGRSPHLWLVPVAAIALAFAIAALSTWGLEIPRGWFLPLLTLTSVGNLGLSILLIRAAARRRRWAIAALFVINVAMIFALQPIAVMEPKTLAIHWLEQILTALGTACFALAAYWLLRAVRGEAGLGQGLIR